MTTPPRTPLERLTAALDDAHAATIDPEHAIVRTDDLAWVLAVVDAADGLLSAAFTGDDYWTANSIPMVAPSGVVRKARALRAALAAIEGSKP